MSQAIKILYLSSELTPLAKAGGLGDVAGALPKALFKLHADIRVMLPYYETIEKQKIETKKIISHLIVPFGKEHHVATIYQADIPNSQVPLYLIHHHEFLSTGPIYSSKRERFMFFTQAINEFLKLDIFQPDIIHVNDWHPAGLLALLKKDPQHKKHHYKSLITIHNLAMTGKILNSKTKLWHPSLYHPSKTKNFLILKQGLEHSDLINTVSPQYAKEILTPEYGTSLLPILKKHRRKLCGIINGIDAGLFSPQKDKYIQYNYNWRSLNLKNKNKRFLQKLCHLPINENIPIFGLVSRLTKQKGVDLIIAIVKDLAKLNVQFIFTGTGKEPIEQALKKAVAKYPKKFFFLNKFDIPFGQYIYAGADIFLMPSLFEPCGLGQMIAMAYGTIPIVRATGGLKDTVKNNKTGFVFNNYQAAELLKTITKSTKLYQNKTVWKKMIRQAMEQDFTWHNSARQYMDLYKKLLKK